MKRRQIYSAFQVVVDILSFVPIWAGTTALRVFLNPLTSRQLAWDDPAWIAPIGFTLLLHLLISWEFKLYSVPGRIRWLSLIVWAAENAMAVVAACVIVDFFSIQFGTGASRLFVLCLAPMTFVVFVSTRFVALFAMRFAKPRVYSSRIAVIGDHAGVRRLLGQMEPESASSVCGLIIGEGAVDNQGDDLPILGSTAQIGELVNSNLLDEVILINGAISEVELAHCSSVLWRMGVPARRVLNLSANSQSPGRWGAGQTMELSNINGLPIVDFEIPSNISKPLRSTRLFDLGVTVLLCLAIAPLFLLLALLVKISFHGSLLIQSSLVGKGGRHFTCYKFRTEDEKPVDPETKVTEESRATTLSKILVRYSLDELPQLFNILRGEMSLVGPRPLPANRLGPDGMSRKFVAWSEARSSVRPGLTGLWQVRGRSNLTFSDMIRLDLQYVQSRSLLLDLRILLETPVALWRTSGNQLRRADSVSTAV